jgi:excisionase family DNA binding protein
MPEREYLTKQEAQELMRICRATLDRYMASGKLKYIKLEKKVLFRKKDIDTFLNKHLMKR